MKTLSQGDRRAVVLGGAVVIAGVLLLRVLPWAVQNVRVDLVDLRERSALVARAHLDLASVTDLRDSAATLTQALVVLAPRLLTGSTAPEAGADLSERINLAVSRSQGKLERLDPVSDSGSAGRLRRAAAHVAFESDIRGFAAFLRAVEGGDAALTVSQVRVVAPDPGSPERQPELLKIEVTVVGWYIGMRERAAS